MINLICISFGFVCVLDEAKTSSVIGGFQLLRKYFQSFRPTLNMFCSQKSIRTVDCGVRAQQKTEKFCFLFLSQKLTNKHVFGLISLLSKIVFTVVKYAFSFSRMQWISRCWSVAIAILWYLGSSANFVMLISCVPSTMDTFFLAFFICTWPFLQVQERIW